MTSGNENLHAKKQGSLLGFFKPQKASIDNTVPPTTVALASIPSAVRNEVKAAKMIEPESDHVSSKNESMDSDSSASDSSSDSSDGSSDLSVSLASSKVVRKRKHVKSTWSPRPVKKREIVSDGGACVTEIDASLIFNPLAPMIEFSSRSYDFHTPISETEFLSSEEIDKLCINVPPFVVTFIHYYYELSSRFDFPSWFDPKRLRDAQGRPPTDTEYDVSTISVTRKNGKVVEEGHSTPMLQQYWSIKEDHFDEIILFKVGKFYELFYMDAAIAQPICNLKWMGHDRRAHVGFPEVSLQTHSYALLQAGYTVCVVEQTETVNEANERSALAGRKSALVERKICEMFTSGTLIHEDMLKGCDAHYLVSLVGPSLVAVDCASGEVRLFTALSDAQKHSLIATLQPKEILLLHDSNPVSPGCKLVKWKQWEGCGIPSPLVVDSEIRDMVKSDRNLTLAVNGIVSYLTHLLLHESVLMCSSWALGKFTNTSSLLDATAISHLEILKDSEGSSRGSLLQYMDQTATPFGSRTMRNWLCAPLLIQSEIEERLSVVEFFVQNQFVRKQIVESFHKLPDLERRLQRICSLGMQQTRGAVFFNEAENKKISLYLGFLESIKSVLVLFANLPQNLPPLVQRLIQTDLTLDDVNKLSSMVKPTKSGGFIPCPGSFELYDSALAEIAELEQQLQAELSKIKKSVSSSATFVHTKYKNEIEVPQDSRLSSDWEITSNRKGFVRFRTDTIKSLVEERDLVDEKLVDLMYPFMAQLFGSLAKDRMRFASLINRVGQLDCLQALAKVSSQFNWVKPVFISSSSPALNISLNDCRHPIQEHLLQLAGKEFVGNDIEMNGNTILVTGANMGGKSTILRQTCVAVILAQVGSFVPATFCSFSRPIDRIFTRIGASDNILQGKSTFLTELEETATILKEASANSLVVIDELGRGTSTFDGVAIAGATLQYLVETIQCNCLFATHYHKLANEPGIKLFHMECLQEHGAVVLTHKFKAGPYPHSQAMHVARIAGLPEKILAQAETISAEFKIQCQAG